ncbi:hypothetical protein B0H19DRAFT_85097 [Mycena capillaripes]|nr:hypothetical protein B0H19DRAFT_85097 [Mycena capillaripes]
MLPGCVARNVWLSQVAVAAQPPVAVGGCVRKKKEFPKKVKKIRNVDLTFVITFCIERLATMDRGKRDAREREDDEGKKRRRIGWTTLLSGS